MLTSALDSGSRGIQAAQDSLNKNAAKIAEFDKSSGDIAGEMVAATLASFQVKASATVIQTADDMNKSILSIAA